MVQSRTKASRAGKGLPHLLDDSIDSVPRVPGFSDAVSEGLTLIPTLFAANLSVGHLPMRMLPEDPELALCSNRYQSSVGSPKRSPSRSCGAREAKSKEFH